MKLKLVVASMSILGFVSCPVFAATDTDVNATTTDTTTTTTTTVTEPAAKTVHHYKHHKKHHAAKRVVNDEYKGYKDMEPAPMPVCTISQPSMIMVGMTQNMGRAIPSPCKPGWFNRIMLSGGINVDMGKWGNRNANYMGENYQRLSLNDAYLNIGAIINDWARAYASISYNTATINSSTLATGAPHVAEYSAAYSNNVQSGAVNYVQLEQAFMSFANYDMSPVFVQIGKQFQDFSRYEIHPITQSMTQVMSETLATSAKIGFILPMGLNGSAYLFDDPMPKVGQNAAPTNYGVALGYDRPSDSFGFDVGAAYLYNLIGANSVAYAVNEFNTAAVGGSTGYNSRVSATAIYADINTGPFTLGARYTTALQRFNILDLPKNGVAASTTGAKPWSFGIEAGYGFDYFWNRTQDIYLGYQASSEAAGLLLPKHRWLAGYGIDVFQDTNFGLEWDHDSGYSTGNGGNNKTTNLVSLRAAVKFS